VQLDGLVRPAKLPWRPLSNDAGFPCVGTRSIWEGCQMKLLWMLGYVTDKGQSTEIAMTVHSPSNKEAWDKVLTAFVAEVWSVSRRIGSLETQDVALYLEIMDTHWEASFVDLNEANRRYVEKDLKPTVSRVEPYKAGRSTNG